MCSDELADQSQACDCSATGAFYAFVLVIDCLIGFVVGKAVDWQGGGCESPGC